MFKRTSQGAKRGWLKATGVVLLISAALILFPTPAYADIPDADVMKIDSFRIARNLWEEGDFLLTFEYSISWDVPENEPDEPADQTLIFRLMDGDETQILGYSVPYVYVYKGYRAGVSSMYWDAETAPPWEQSAVLWFMENPGLDPDPRIVKQAISNGDYSPYETQADNRKYVTGYIINAAKALEQAWEVAAGSLIGDGNYFTIDGETYFQGAVPGLKLFCPDLFTLIQVTPTYEEEEWTLEHQTATEAQWEGTWIATSLEGISELFGGVKWSFITAAACGLGFLGLLFFCYRKFEDVKPGLLLGILPIVAGSVLGFVPLVAMGLVCFGAIMFIAYTFWFKAAA